MLLAAFWATGSGASVQEPDSTWYLVQPIGRAALIDPLLRHYLKHLPHYLDGKVVVRESAKAALQDRVRAAFNDERAERTAMLLTPLPYGQFYDEQIAMRSEVRAVTLQLVAQRPWCLAAAQDLKPRSRAGLSDWLTGLKRPVRIGLASSRGMPEIWIRAMQRKTGLTWVTTDFFANAERGLNSLLIGQQDLLLETCAELDRMRASGAATAGSNPLHVLLSGRPVADRTVATFEQWQLPTPAPSWLAWFASSKMPEARRNRLGKAINQVTLREDTQALIRELGQDAMPLNMADSQRYVDGWLRDWKSISNWMNSLPAKAQSEPAGAMAPVKAGH